MKPHAPHAGHSAAIQMILLNQTEEFRSHEETKLVFRPVRPAAPDERVPLAISHEADFHLIVLNENLTWFQHVHPALQADGSYFITLDFPSGGAYTLVADYQPVGHAPVTDKLTIRVKGNAPSEAAESLQRLTFSEGGLHLRIVADSPFTTGNAGHIPIKIDHEGTPVQAGDLTPYLGAVAHIILIGKDDRNFLHIHPMSDPHYPIIAHTQFTTPGIYRMWVQFKTGNTLHTADFTLDVVPGKSDEAHSMAGHHHH